ncbi:hypothetical protein [Methylobacterium ajmalii]|uniref:hypothetical protein n=1 Tax=Methylobacterium ajmalii TaxID=2738439 RepID=UPI002F35CA0A
MSDEAPVAQLETLAEGYIRLVRMALPLTGSTQAELRQWWRGETLRRRQYGLTPEQEALLADLCRERLATLPPGETAPARNAAPARRRALI